MPAMKNPQVPTSDVVEFQQRASSHSTTLPVGRVAARTTVLNQGLHPALKSLGLPKGGLHGFRRGCNRSWEPAGINPAVIRQQMGHTSARMTTLYSGKIPLGQVRAAFSKKAGTKIDVMENMENEVAT